MKFITYVVTALLLISFFAISAWLVIPALLIIAAIDLSLWTSAYQLRKAHERKVIQLLEQLIHQSGGVVNYRGAPIPPANRGAIRK